MAVMSLPDAGRINWHKVGVSGLVVTHAMMMLAAVLTAPGLNRAGWLWFAATLGFITVVYRLIGHRQSSWWWFTWPVIGLVRLINFSQIDHGAAQLVPGVIFLACLFAGLTQPPGRSLLLLPLAAVATYLLSDRPLHLTLVHLGFAAIGWALTCELPALLLHRLSDREHELQVTSETDCLTGTRNRHGLDELLQGLAHRGFLVIADLDHFKQYNDKFGHLAGDQVLADFAAMLMQQSRHDDVVVRYGGEEFLVVLVDVDQSTAQRVVDRWNRSWRNHPSEVTFSAGITDLQGDQDLQRADLCLYAAKAAGRDRSILNLSDATTRPDDRRSGGDLLARRRRVDPGSAN